MDFLRLLGAGLFILFGLLIAVVVASQMLPDDSPTALILVFILPPLILLFVAASFLFNLRGRLTYKTSVPELEKKDLITSTEFHAKRAFLVDEFEDEGIHYFIELINGSVLFLSGQYLYGYEPTYYGEAVERKFPCTEFTIRRHKVKHYAIDIDCRGEPLPPEITFRPFDEENFEKVPTDGSILTDLTYDDIKNELAERHRG